MSCSRLAARDSSMFHDVSHNTLSYQIYQIITADLGDSTVYILDRQHVCIVPSQVKPPCIAHLLYARDMISWDASQFTAWLPRGPHDPRMLPPPWQGSLCGAYRHQ